MTRMVRIGTVLATDGLRARVLHSDTGVQSGWLYILQRPGEIIDVAPDNAHSHGLPSGSTFEVGAHNHPGTVVDRWAPKPGAAVLVLYDPTPDGDGYILGEVK